MTKDIPNDGEQDAKESPTDSEPADSARRTVQFSVVFEDDEDEGEGGAAVTVSDAHMAVAAEDDHEAGDANEKPEPGSSSDTETSGDGTDDIGDEGEANIPKSNADHVHETLNLVRLDARPPEAETTSGNSTAEPEPDEPTVAVSSRIDRELGRRAGKEDLLLRAYPIFAFDHATFIDHKSGRHLLDDLSLAFYPGNVYAVSFAEDVQRVAFLQAAGGFARLNSGAVMLKSANMIELEPSQVRSHRIGIVPQRFAVRSDMDAVGNLVHAMDASGRTFLKPKPVLARELLHNVGFNAAPSGIALAELSPLDRRLVAVARAISCEQQIILVDEPTSDLGDDDKHEVLELLAKLAYHGDPRRCVIMLTSSTIDMDASDEVYSVE